jgi:RNA polymerase sigma-70 factor (ECF subfamily)
MLDRSDFMEHYLKMERPIRAYLMASTGNLHAVDDLTQNVWRTLWAKLDEYDESRPFRAWAMGVARIEALRWRQKQARSREYLSPEVIMKLADTAGDVGEELDLRRTFLLECVKELKESSRRVVELKYGRRMRIRDVAKSIGKSTPAVEMMLVRIRRALRKCIDGKLAYAGMGDL